MTVHLHTLPIPGYEGLYEITSDGRVFSLGRIVPTLRPGGSVTTVPGCQLRPHIDRYGYGIVTLHRDGNGTRIGVHRALCMAFHGPPPHPRMHAAHRDGVKLNNTVANIRWATVAENNEDRRRHGAHPMGDRLPHSKLTAEQAREIVNRARSGETYSSLGRDYGISNVAARKVALGKSWGHATGFTRTPEIEAEIARLNEVVA